MNDSSQHEPTLPPKYQPATPDPLHRRALRILKGTASFEDRFVPDVNEAAALLHKLREMGCKVAFVTGVWDFFHIGHSAYLRRGKEDAGKLYPDADHLILVVGIDTDALTKERKGPTRPIVPERERWTLLGDIRPVDVIVPQSQSDQLYAILPHDVRIISESTKDLPGQEKMRLRCEHIVNLPPQAETSTTERYRRLVLEGGHEALEKIRAKMQPALDQLSKVIEEVRSEIEN